jgi:hypothetical protein
MTESSLVRRVLISIIAYFLPLLILAEDEPIQRKQGTEAVSSSDAPIKITINPEARVSVTLAGALPPPAACGMPVDLAVMVVNQGFVTFRLEAKFVGEPPAGAELEFHPEPLRGVPEEFRGLRIILRKPGTTDLTVAFRARNRGGDLGGRDRVHFLMRCLKGP